uniref:Uncharacterized protein n=1 Tax=Plectus sambesii TaxID=2011161 RepID=A0A914XKC7_9BILA
MGMCQSQEDKELMMKSRQIDREMVQEHLANQKIVKLLLLGAGECGKSTVLKQMRILHDNGFSDEEIMQQRAVVFSNTVQSMALILRAMNTLNIPLDKAERETDARIVLDVIKSGDDSEPFSPQLATALKRLWADKAVCEEAYSRRSEFQLNDSAKFFLDKIDDIAHPKYRPSEQDILHTRVKTTGIVEVKFQLKNVEFRVFDVGGQRSERKKWIHCFEDVNAI